MSLSRSVIQLCESAIADLYRSADNMDIVDRAIRKYTLNSLEMYALLPVWDEAVSRYPLKKDTVVYRGMNFSDKESYDKFINSIKGGVLVTEDIISWSPNKSTAEQFAVTRPTYMEFMSRDTMDLISKQSREGERITGYRGVILATTAKRDVTLNVSASKLGAENEVILPPGKYRVTYEDVLSYKDILKDPNDSIMSLTRDSLSDSDNQKFLYFILKKDPSLSKEARSHLFNITKPNNIRFEIEKTEDRGVSASGKSITVYGAGTDTLISKFYTNSDLQKLGRELKPHLQKLIKDIKNSYDPGAKINYRTNLRDLVRVAGVESEFNNMLKDTIGASYNKITSKDRVDDINKITDPEEKRDAIRKEADRIKDLIASIA